MWALVYPDFRVVVPTDETVTVPIAYAVARPNGDLEDLISKWIMLKIDSGEFEEIYNHWVLGRDRLQERPRWSVIRDVLHWVD